MYNSLLKMTVIGNNRRLFSKTIKYIDGDKMPNICRDCKYFRKSHYLYHYTIELGKCTKISNLDLVTGFKTYNYASVVREFDCKGNWYEENKKFSIFNKK